LNYKESNKLIRNILSLSLGQVLNLLLNFFSIILAARFLGVENFGQFNYYLAIITILSNINDLGINTILFRELSKNNNNVKLLIQGLNFKFFLFVTILFFFIIISKLLNTSNEEIFLLSIMFLGIILSSKFQNFRDVLDIPFKVSLSMNYPIIFALLDNIILLIGVLIMNHFNLGLLYFVIIYTFSNIPGFIFTLILLKKKFNISFQIKIDNYKWLIKETKPLWGFAILFVIYQQADLILLQYISNSYDTGIYSSALKLTIPFSVIYYALVTSIYPKLTNYFDIDNKKVEFYSKISLKILFLISFSLALIISFKSKEILYIFFGNNYVEANHSLILLSFSQVFLFFNMFSSSLIVNMNVQKYNFYYAILVACFTIILSFLLIPKYSYNGAALSKLISTIIGTTFFMSILSKKHFSFNIINLQIIIWILMTIFSSFLFMKINFFIFIIIIPLIILILSIFLNFFSKQEIVILLKLFNKEKWLEKIKIIR